MRGIYINKNNLFSINILIYNIFIIIKIIENIQKNNKKILNNFAKIINEFSFRKGIGKYMKIYSGIGNDNV